MYNNQTNKYYNRTYNDLIVARVHNKRRDYDLLIVEFIQY